MKPLLSIFLMVVCAFAQTCSAPSTSASSQSIPVDQENARKAKALLEQTIQALGGEAYLNLQDSSQEGRSYSFYHGRPNSLGVLYWRFTRFPDKERVELTKKRDVIYVYNGDKGYEITYKGTALEDAKTMADYVRRRQFSLDWVLRRWLDESGVAFFYDGTAVAEQKPADQVTIMNNRNQAVTLYLDPGTHLPIKKSYSWRDEVDKQRDTEDEVYDNYRSIQGVMTPFSLTRYYNSDMASQRFLNSVSYNQNLSDSLFSATATYDPNRPPAKK
jgi:hypothetical protein